MTPKSTNGRGDGARRSADSSAGRVGAGRSGSRARKRAQGGRSDSNNRRQRHGDDRSEMSRPRSRRASNRAGKSSRRNGGSAATQQPQQQLYGGLRYGQGAVVEESLRQPGLQLDLDNIDYQWALDELELDREYQRGDSDGMVWNIQEWLSLQGHSTGIDGDFGPATASAVRSFQQAHGLQSDGVVDDATFAALVSPMARALQPIVGVDTLGELAVRYAEQHLSEHPREVGGQNRGPWVRLYMQGNDGTDFAWCAGFACFMLRQAADTLNVDLPFKTSFSCDVLASGAQSNGIFVSESDFSSGRAIPAIGSIFLSRKTSTDWTHAGLVTVFEDEAFQTIEGNTNDEGSREGYEVCRRSRAYNNMDFLAV